MKPIYNENICLLLQGLGDGFVEVYNGLQRQHRVSKLQASTKYMFRVAAINNVGKRLVHYHAEI